MKNILLAVLLLLTNSMIAKEESGDFTASQKSLQESTTWLFKNNSNNKVIALRKGGKIKVHLHRKNPGDEYLIKGTLEDINNTNLIVRKKEVIQEVKKSLVKRIIIKSHKGIQVYFLGILLFLLGTVAGVILFIAVYFSGLKLDKTFLLVGVAAVLFLFFGKKLMDDYSIHKIAKPFSGEWEITKIKAKAEELPPLHIP
ncbi:MAG: hypothetical protein MI974_11440 [Chitinophagales bacterium]|nr:hypothetical protein [Chitinophagales bacterium]